MSIEVDYELLIRDILKLPKDKHEWFGVVSFVEDWLYRYDIKTSVHDVIDIIRSLEPELIPQNFISPGVYIREIDYDPYISITMDTVF